MAEVKPGYCTLCRSRCGSLNTVEDGRLVAVDPLPDHPTGGALCSKGRAAPEIAGSARRLTHPLRRSNPKDAHDPGWVEVSWDEALDDIAQRLQQIKSQSGAESVAFAATTPSGTAMVDSLDWVERLVRTFGSPNLVYAVENCGWHKDHAHELTFGADIGAPDYDRADLIILWGHNPARTWLAQATRIADARRRGAHVVVIDPKRQGSGQQADLWLGLRPGSDGALALGAIRHLIHARQFDSAFVRSWTNAPFLVDHDTGRFIRASESSRNGPPEGFVVWDSAMGSPRSHQPEERLDTPHTVALTGTYEFTDARGRRRIASPAFDLLSRHVEEWTVERVARTTLVDERDIRRFYDLVSSTEKISYYSWTGVGQHSNATQTERAIAVAYALTGACDRLGGNRWLTSPTTNALNDVAILDDNQRAKALGLADLPLGPPRLGWITAHHFRRAVLEQDPYPVRALVSFGSNFLVSQGDSAQNARALESLEFQVHVDLFMNPTAMTSDYVLPANSPWEREALKIGFEITQEAAEHVQLRQQMIPPVGESRSDYAIAAELACRLGYSEHFFNGDIEAGWNHQLRPIGLTVEQLRQRPEGVRVPQEQHFEKYARSTEAGGVNGFSTPTRRVELYSETLFDHGYDPLPTYSDPTLSTAYDNVRDGAYPLVMSTHKNGNFVHTSHRHIASLRRRSPEPTVDVHPTLAFDRGLADGDVAIVETPVGQARLNVRFDPDLHPSTLLCEFGWWEDCPPLGRQSTPVFGADSANINAALDDASHDPISGSVPLRAVRCELRKASDRGDRSWSGRRKFVVEQLQRRSLEVLSIAMRPVDGGQLPAVMPGQHVLLETGHHATRAYSVTSVDDRRQLIGIAVKHVPGGAVSGHIHQNLTVGHTVWLSPPAGSFTPPLATDRPVVLIAGGIGITPFINYIRTLEEAPSRPPRVLLLNGCVNGTENAFRKEIARIGARVHELEVLTWYAEPAPTDNYPDGYQFFGFVDPHVLDERLLRQRPLFYLCGPPPMMDTVTDSLVSRGVPRFDILSEVFRSAQEIPTELEPRTVHLTDSNVSFTWTAELGTLLEAADRNEVSLPSGCRVGQCESCSVQLVSGSVAHLGENESDPGACLTCQAVPLTNISLQA